jgi:ABC-type multidrug transport system ATPase subunit
VSTIRDAEQIVVLDKGKIVGKGTHKELIKNCVVYQEICKSQLSDDEYSKEFETEQEEQPEIVKQQSQEMGEEEVENAGA